MKNLVLTAVLSGLALMSGAASVQAQSIADFASTPLDAHPRLSPNGRWLATHCTQRSRVAACVYDLQANALAHIIPAPEGAWLDSASFASDDFLLLSLSSYNTMNTGNGIRRFQVSRTLSLDVASGEVALLAPDLRGSTNTTNIVSLNIDDPHTVIMEMNYYRDSQAQTGSRYASASGFESLLYEVDLASGDTDRLDRSEIMGRVVDAQGEVVAEIHFEESSSLYEIREPGRNGDVIYSRTHLSDAPSILGFIGENAFLAIFPSERGGYRRIDRSTGEISMLGEIELDIVSRPIWDQDKRLVGFSGERDGLKAQHLFDEGLRNDARALGNALGAPVIIESFTPDRNMLLLTLSEPGRPQTYYLYERSAGSVAIVAEGYPNLSEADLPQRRFYAYEASDGLQLEGVLTTPPGWTEADGPLPLIVLPHGGPASRDDLDFDWWSQAYASEGYLVLQPNFRGSTGYGVEFQQAGYGEFGDRMVEDVLDGGRALQAAGLARPDPFCVAGASYGGYAALRAAIMAPQEVACVVAVAPVTDPVDLLAEARSFGGSVFAYDFWEQYIGDIVFDRDEASRISIARNAARLTAPVLLMHGDVDAVVPLEASEALRRNMSRDQSLDYVELEGENHFLHLGASRQVLLTRSLALFDETLR